MTAFSGNRELLASPSTPDMHQPLVFLGIPPVLGAKNEAINRSHAGGCRDSARDHVPRPQQYDFTFPLSRLLISRAMSATNRVHRVAFAVAVYLISAIIGFLIVEAGYRIRLTQMGDPRIQWPTEANAELPQDIGAYDRSPWQFDATEGFRYVANSVFYNAQVVNGKRVTCIRHPVINAYGGEGLSEGAYETAQVKLAIFGDSFTGFTGLDYLTWVNYLQRLLQERLARSVYALNFARDGTGVVQMFDVAANELPRYKPDLAVIAFTTNSAVQRRIWRLEKRFGGELRAVTEYKPDRNPDLNSTFETYILEPRADAAWCAAHKDGGPLDDVSAAIIDKYLRFRPRRYSVYTPFHSFFWHRVMNGDAFFDPSGRNPSPGLSEQDVASDPRLANDIKSISQTGIPYILVHLPYYPEVQSQKKYFTPPDERTGRIAEQIALEIRRLTKHPIYEGLGYMPLPIDHPEKMNVSSENMHPSAWGMQLYANAVTRIVLESDAKETLFPR
jgi:hypothetical protein